MSAPGGVSPGFAGFPEGKARLTPIPNAFFSELLPRIDHLGELKLTLYAFWSLSQKQGRFQYIRREEIAADPLFMQGLAAPATPAELALDEALERAVARGTLLEARLAQETGEERYYFVNSPKGRAALQGLESGAWRPSGDPQAPLELQLERPNIYRLYEQNIGPLTPMLAEKLRSAEDSYPASWVEEAIGIAVENNVRRWRYVEAILEDWMREGKDEREHRGDSEKARRRYLEGELGDSPDG